MEETSELKKRYYLIDSVRGLFILGMILYHTLFDVVMVFGFDYNSGFMQGVNVIRDFGASCFIFISGLCFHFGRHHIKRSAMIFLFGLIITLVTYIVMPDCFVICGILTFMGTAGLIMPLLDKGFSKIPPAVGLIISFAAFLFMFEVNYGYVGYYSKVICWYPFSLYRNYLTAFFGFPFDGFISSDFYSFFPWIFMYFCGYFAWNIIKKSEKIQMLLMYRIPFLEKTGKYSLWIYAAHQPVVYGIVSLSYILINR